MHWYDRTEFIHESELIPLEEWRTRYIYVNSYLSHVGSELMSRDEEVQEDLASSYAAYSLEQFKRTLFQFSNDGYYNDPASGMWRIMRHPYRTPDESPEDLYTIDESGRHLPDGLPLPQSSNYAYACSRLPGDRFSCGFGPKAGQEERLAGNPHYGHVGDMGAAFPALLVEPDRIVITQRVSKGEPFRYGPEEWSALGTLFFYANFDDPVRPVVFAPGVLLQTFEKGRPVFVAEETCLTDCPGEVNWQYAERRSAAGVPAAPSLPRP